MRRQGRKASMLHSNIYLSPHSCVCAGKAGRPPCYLLATEGDSAKDLAVCGMEIVGRDCYGVIPLRGVIRNVRPAKVRRIHEYSNVPIYRFFVNMIVRPVLHVSITPGDTCACS